MKELLLLRHAKSSWKTAGLSDHDRPLNARGKRDASRVGQLLRDEQLQPDLILSSTAKRARKTAKKVARASGLEVRIELLDDLYHSGTSVHIQLLGEQSADSECIMIVAHNPGLEATLETLVGQYQRLPTSALAHLTLPIIQWSELDHDTAATLNDLWLPREI